MKGQLKEQAIRLRLEQNLGYSSIAKILPVSRSTLSGWLKDYPLTEERIRELRALNLKNNEVKIERFRNAMRKKREETFDKSYLVHLRSFKKISKQARFIGGLMLYLAEGGKKDYYHISLANTDPRVIKFFIKWAAEFLDIPKDVFKIQLHLYPTMTIEDEIKFWKQELGITDKQFYKHQIRKLQKTSFTYRESFRHGTCTACFSSSKKKRELMAAISAFVDSFLK